MTNNYLQPTTQKANILMIMQNNRIIFYKIKTTRPVKLT